MTRHLPLLAVLLLASCAPTLSGSAAGRIVNVRTGDEGRLTFIGGFRDRATLPGDPDNVTVTVGGRTYSGTYTVLGNGRPNLGVSVGFGTGFGWGGADTVFGRASFGDRPAPTFTRPGNLVARTTPATGDTAQTLTCTFQADANDHGIGSCQDSLGASYTLQF
ncbi:hypothetical protein [Deinococcus aquiradiocola]|uniref:Lipoprotein n=1 Tax=Deinococcus aquiradiocola TaxID=393059 RepID=A0A917UPH6_9DEIO|nr:hypothetical protein [Deinococcus aquiradiocola]GGJ72206.1 hypothetical protein GCM10008939_15720 [Deinococcus aquiradiocola]